jgi:hypothetical protein
MRNKKQGGKRVNKGTHQVTATVILIQKEKEKLREIQTEMARLQQKNAFVVSWTRMQRKRD